MPKGGSQLLELTLLSARDLAHVSKSMKPFAVVWMDPKRKLETRPDAKGQNCPTWNEKFVFRLENESNDYDDIDSAVVNLEIYATTRRSGDAAVPIGSVTALVSSLFPSEPLDRNNQKYHRRSRTRFLTLQLRRPSGRPQGMVDLAVALLDGTRRSMPLSGSDLTASDAIIVEQDHHHQSRNYHQRMRFRRSKSERSISEVYLLKPAGTESDSVVSDIAANGTKGRGSVSSDVGPSPSVVAAAIAMGVYQKKRLAVAVEDTTAESSILEDWIEEDDDSVEGLKTKIERWRSEIHPLYQSNNNVNNNIDSDHNMMMIRRSTYKKNNASGDVTAALAAATPLKRSHRRPGSGLFSCFGTAYGCEFSITCGGKGGRKKKSGGDGGDDDDDDGPISMSELHYGDQYV